MRKVKLLMIEAQMSLAMQQLEKQLSKLPILHSHLQKKVHEWSVETMYHGTEQGNLKHLQQGSVQ